MGFLGYLSIDPSPPYIKSNRVAGWIFFAYPRVFIEVPEGSCGLRGFSGCPEIHHFCSPRVDSLRNGERTKRFEVRKSHGSYP